MTLFRYRQWGSPDWIELSINDSGEDDFILQEIINRIREALRLAEIHAQECNDDGQWEDLD